MQNMTIGKRLGLGFSVVLVIVAILGGYTAYQLRTVESSVDRIVVDSLPGTALSGAIMGNVKAAYTDALEHIASTDAKEMDAAQADILRIRGVLTKQFDAYQKTITMEEDRANFEKIQPLRKAFLETMDASLAFSKEGKKAEALAYLHEKVQPTFEQYDAAVVGLADWNAKEGATSGDVVAKAIESTYAGVLVGVGLAIALGILIAFLIVRSTGSVLRASVRTLKDGAHQVTAASTQVSSASQSLSQGATEQAASIEETSASMEEMASMSRQNANNSRQAETLIRTVDTRVNESNQSLGAMVSSMTAIKESSNNISRIIKTIDEIAFQTNILALNAAVEAARAGEAGMGFAVVADEVHRLAQRSAEAARNTADLIEQSIVRSNEGAERVEQMAGSIRSITDAVGEVRQLVEAVSTASQQQAQGFDQVSQAIAQMEKVTQTNAATAEESAAASEELNAQAEASLVAVEEIAHLVGDSQESPAAPKSASPKAGAGTSGKMHAFERHAA